MILDIVLDLSNLFDDVWYSILIITANNQGQKMVINVNVIVHFVNVLLQIYLFVYTQFKY